MPRKEARAWTREQIDALSKVGPGDEQLTKAAWRRDARTDAKPLIDATVRRIPKRTTRRRRKKK
jgi:hypothetical protein